MIRRKVLERSLIPLALALPVALSVTLSGVIACGGSSTGVVHTPDVAPPPPMSAAPAPSAAAPAAPEGPPPPGLAPDWKFPAIVEQALKNGLAVRLVERHALPLVEITLVVSSGSASDGPKPGLATVAGELLKAGGAGKWQSRALLDAAAALGSWRLAPKLPSVPPLSHTSFKAK